MYIMTSFHTATEDKLEIHLMDHLYPDMLAVNTRDDIIHQTDFKIISIHINFPKIQQLIYKIQQP